MGVLNEKKCKKNKNENNLLLFFFTNNNNKYLSKNKLCHITKKYIFQHGF